MLRQVIQWLESGERIAARDPEVRAWVEVAPRPIPKQGLLRGVPFGAKDIFETRGLATEYGSPLYSGRKGTRDAAVVDELAKAGAVLLGKTQTTAFASFDPAPTRNPRLSGHTPGGSSSGSAAAVAAGMAPFALGTQTLGSVLRPASYCGVCGFKPSFGLVPIAGALPFAPSLDTVGFFTQTAADMVALWERGFGGRASGRLRRAAFFRLPVEEPMAAAMEQAADRLRGHGVEVEPVDPPEGWAELTAAALTINEYEGARTHAARHREFGGRIGQRLSELVCRGLAVPGADYHAAQERVARMREAVASIFWDYPVVLSPAATGPAPAGYESTGNPTMNAPWTALGLPAIGIPMPSAKAPVGLQITAAWGRDDALVAVAAHAEEMLADGCQ